MNNDFKYDIKIITEDLQPFALDFLKRFFFRDEPLVKYLNLIANAEATEALEGYAMKSISDNVSLLAMTEDNQIIGVLLNSIKEKEARDGKEITNPIFGKIASLLGYLEVAVNIFEMYPDLQKYMSLDIISVDSSYRRQGLAQALVNKARDLARSQGLGLLRTDCTSLFSAKAMARMGFECIYEINYADYKEDGKQVFDCEFPHVSARVYIRKIES